MNINESKTIHIYQDQDTGNRYYFNGKKLIYLGKSKSNTIGDIGDKDAYEQELERHAQEVAKELEDSGEQGETEEEKQARLKRIDDLLNNSEVSDDIVKETEKVVKQDKELRDKLKKIKSSTEAQYYTSGDIEKFKLDLKRFVKDQVRARRRPSWKVENQKYAGTGIIRKGYQRKQEREIPLINVYFDQSASWTDSDLNRGKEAIGVLNEYVNKKLIEIKVYYFANHIHSTPGAARAEAGTRAGKELIEHVVATKPKNVIVITDQDFDWQGNLDDVKRVTIPGAVMFLFRDGEVSQKLVKKLRGKQHNKLYNF